MMAHRSFVVFLVLSVALALDGFACQVPVFRYALERWSVDRYRVVVLHEAPLDGEAKEALAALQLKAKSDADGGAEIDLKVVDVTSTKDRRILARWKKHKEESESPNSGSPLMLVFYPAANDVPGDGLAFQADLTSKNVSQLLDSPLRCELTTRLAQGHSAIWVFVPCGREEEDKAMYESLEKQLAADAKRFELPTAEEMEIDEKVLRETKVPLTIVFSIVTLDRDDPKEKFVLSSLLNSEEDLADFDQPLAFPVFGQGRVLYCLVGKGIAEDTIRAASGFMVGPCSCQVKNQNPGFDLLLRNNWKDTLGDVLVSDPIETLNKEGLEPTLLTIPPGRKTN